MDISHIFDSLNKEQREAVAAEPGPVLVLAGAGSGKTRVLTHRIAWLIQGQHIPPPSILAVTFTNKAAREMRGRLAELLDIPLRNLWIGTFHGLCLRLLRLHAPDAGLPEPFEILDSDDQYRLIRRVLKEHNLNEDYWPPKQIQWMINQHKEEGRRARHLPAGHDIQQQTLLQIYLTYEERCQRDGLADFAELLLRTLELLQNNQSLREHYQQRFRHVLVDEFQDTNAIQYRWLRILTQQHKHCFAVGDDDQSIYGWRGAKVENMLSFEKDFPESTVIRLEQNYRSTGNILNAANSVIANNTGRMGKNLWTDATQGLPLRMYAARNEIDEARFVVDQISHWITQGNRRDEAAILYRSNAQSRIFEEKLLAEQIPYRVYGGLRFFERAEIKDALAYLKLMVNRDSDPAFERVVNVPARGIGNRTLEVIREQARTGQVSMWKAARETVDGQTLPTRALTAISRFVDLIEQLSRETGALDLEATIDHVLKRSGLLDHCRKEKGERAEGRIENLEELVTAGRRFVPEEENREEALSLFLNNAALEAGEGQADEWDDCVQLMSLHSSKGLEFPVVFLCGMEEGLFPHQRSLEEPGRLEEERRLCYVGMTRAMQQLYICYAEIRQLYGRSDYTRQSRFLTEIPAEFIEEIRSSTFSRPLFRPPQTPTDHVLVNFQPGRQVRHKKFGEGMVINLEGQGNQARIQVNFVDVGPKWLIYSYANLEPV